MNLSSGVSLSDAVTVRKILLVQFEASHLTDVFRLRYNQTFQLPPHSPHSSSDSSHTIDESDAAIWSPERVSRHFLKHLCDHIDQSLQTDISSRINAIEYFDSKSEQFLLLFRKDETRHEIEGGHRLMELLLLSSSVIRLSVRFLHENSNKLAIKGRAFSLDQGLNISSLDKGIYHLSIKEVSEGGAMKGTGLVSWDGAVVLAKYLESRPDLVKGKRVLELGSGTGIVGLASHFLGASSVVLSDLTYALQNLEDNVQHNLQKNRRTDIGDISMQMIDWCDQSTYPISHSWDVIVGSDIVWLEDLVPPLVRTISACAESGRTVLLIAHQVSCL